MRNKHVEAISKISFGPNFVFEIVLRKYTGKQRLSNILKDFIAS